MTKKFYCSPREQSLRLDVQNSERPKSATIRLFRLMPLVCIIATQAVVAKDNQIEHADYLILLDPKFGLGTKASYQTLYERKLFVTPGNLARFVELPGPLAQTEIAVSVYQKDTQPSDYWMTLTEPSRRLADCDPVDPALPKVDPSTIKVRRNDAHLPESAALAVHKLWVTMLQQARSDPCKNCFGEGTIGIFSAMIPNEKTLQAAMLYSGPKTLSLAKLASELIGYCRAPATERDRIAHDIESKATELQRRAQK
jgi:hypothetical protein